MGLTFYMVGICCIEGFFRFFPDPHIDLIV
jgi:hypothetical protein